MAETQENEETTGGARRSGSRLARLKTLRKRTWVIIGTVAVLVIAGGTTAGVLLTRQSAAQAAPVTQTVTASLEALEQTVTTTGTLTPAVQEEVSFAPSGTVTSVAVAAGDTVGAGQTLATVDSLTANAELLQAQADLAEAQADLASAQADADGTAASTARIAAREAAVTVAQQSVTSAETALAGVTLTSPVAGLVTAVNIEVGDTVTGTSSSSSSSGGSAASSQSGGGQGAGGSSSTSTTSSAQFTIVGTSAWTVSASLGETEIGLVEAGDQVELETDDGTQLFGVVSEVGKLPSTTSGSASYTVDIDITGEPEGLYDGTSVTATIIYERRNDVLTVPSAAVTTAEDGTTTVTLVDADGNETEQEVTVGETVGDLTEIVSGLSEGDQVLVTVFTPGSGSGTEGGDSTGGQMPDFGSGEMPDFSSGEMPDFSQMPSGGFPGGGQ